MISMHLQQAADSVKGRLQGKDSIFSGCSTDTRQLQQGELFIALRGEHFDGHAFLDQAIASGACAAMVEHVPDQPLPVIVVDDCRKAMSDLAHSWRQQFEIPVVAITGSNGKTTVKEMLAAILRQLGPVLSTRGNLNNDIGVPLTLFGRDLDHRYAVIEMGANHPGEIDGLTRTAEPHVALITQCAPAHLEGFGSVDGVARAKAEIYNGLVENGVAIINLDDTYAGQWRQATAHLRQITFGLDSNADVRAINVQPDHSTACYSFELVSAGDSTRISLALPGQHNVQNALAAAACAIALEVDAEYIKQGLEEFGGVPGRLQIKPGIAGSRILDDTYNANPGSLRAAIDVLKSLHGRHWLVLGDMGELGPDTEQLHQEMGELARSVGIERLYGLGPISIAAVTGFGEGARHFESISSLVTALKADVDADVALLVKGSRAMQMEQVASALSREDS
ncbi:MAG: UDP-N-acetylmuramoyl-tripeptide--D-alanyl-D-alanine ligase [Thiotrichales bacterium]|nr:UDP-N-acetylmuramoyl-tripeptide--D-alanyl-D-alanine ligase [Thiotrichales bacterium]